MSWLNRSLLAKVCTGIISGIALILITAFWGGNQLRSAITSYDHLVSHDFGNALLIETMNSEFKTQVQEWKNVLIRGADSGQREKYWGRFNKQQETVQSVGKELLQKVDLPQAHALLEQFISEHQKMGQAYNTGYQAFVAANYDSAVGDKAVSGIDRAPTKLLNEASEIIVKEAHTEASLLHDGSLSMVILVSVLMLILSVSSTALIIWFINKSVVSPTLAISRYLETISQGDLNQDNPVQRDDELGTLADSASNMQRSLRDTVQQLNTTLNDLTQASNQLKGYSDDINDSTNQQHLRTDQVATAMNEMSATANEVANHAANASGAANEADESAQTGMKVMDDALSTIAAMANEIHTTSTVIAELETNSTQIGTVLDVIRSIAEQTNLLALNAAIEAARAGEQGRGFAVVADEVRTLAQRTQESTREIQEIIEKVQLGAGNAVSAIDQSTTKMTESQEIVSEAAEQLRSITTAVEAIRDMNTQIATAAEEQSSVSEDITRNITEITTIASDNSENAQNTASTSQVLIGLSNELGQISQRLSR